MYNKNLKANATFLRNNMTKEEKHLWYDYLKSLPVTIHRQKIIGPYILDFYCAKSKLGIELDGSQHYTDPGLKYDKNREQYLNNLGINVLRFTNYDINYNFDGVCEKIYKYISSGF